MEIIVLLKRIFRVHSDVLIYFLTLTDFKGRGNFTTLWNSIREICLGLLSHLEMGRSLWSEGPRREVLSLRILRRTPGHHLPVSPHLVLVRGGGLPGPRIHGPKPFCPELFVRLSVQMGPSSTLEGTGRVCWGRHTSASNCTTGTKHKRLLSSDSKGGADGTNCVDLLINLSLSPMRPPIQRSWVSQGLLSLVCPVATSVPALV